LFISIGTVIIDDIVLPDGTTHMGCLGGGSVHAVMGMRVWSENVGLIAKIGHDFPARQYKNLQEVIDLRGLIRSTLPTTRAWQLFEKDGTRREVFRTEMSDFWQLVVKVDNFPPSFPDIQGVHLHCLAKDVPLWVQFLRQKYDPLILWEPWDMDFIPENHQRLRTILPLVDAFSPALEESRKMLETEKIQTILDTYLEYGAPLVAIRMGSKGSIFANAEGDRLQIPPVPVKQIVDVTGAGNAYCGGLVVGLVQTKNFQNAVCCAAVSASFALEQFGALFSFKDIHLRAEQRFRVAYDTIAI